MVSLEYLAGIVDGEGTIRINQVRANKRTIVNALMLSVANTHVGLLKAIQADYGGKIHASGPRSSPKWKHCYRVAWTGGKAMHLIARIHPFLIVKRAQADLAFEFWEQQQGQWHQRLTADEQYANNQFYLKMRALNARGPRPEPVPPYLEIVKAKQRG